jgi:hypothetical protein
MTIKACHRRQHALPRGPFWGSSESTQSPHTRCGYTRSIPYQIHRRPYPAHVTTEYVREPKVHGVLLFRFLTQNEQIDPGILSEYT